jgi:hypothetical protein
MVVVLLGKSLFIGRTGRHGEKDFTGRTGRAGSSCAENHISKPGFIFLIKKTNIS